MLIKNRTFDKEREFYDSDGISLEECVFEGEADGESAFKESRNLSVKGCTWRLRYPFWHCRGVNIEGTQLTELCRAALWYSENINIKSSRLHGIKALRECRDISIESSDIISPEFGWFSGDIRIKSCKIEGEYFMLRAEKLSLSDTHFKGKYSFQYVKDAVIESCTLDTKDAFWHARNVTVKNCTVKGEYLAWYAENITFINCRISGTQPFCYCRGLTLINCTMDDADLAFERSTDIDADIRSIVVSIKNPYSGRISLPYAKEIIIDDENAKCEITESEKGV